MRYVECLSAIARSSAGLPPKPTSPASTRMKRDDRCRVDGEYLLATPRERCQSWIARPRNNRLFGKEKQEHTHHQDTSTGDGYPADVE